ncbi:SPFH domain-containing protein [Candidatus Peregrinibacteria bacterium]|nr:MAG: SPFH domain-containing protein [Candidatus Peregrinibacteria bacterium]
MSFLHGLQHQLRSVIEWDHKIPHALFEKWSENGYEIKNASKLIVNPGEGAVFVYEGEVKSVLTKAGTYTLETDNIPFWTTVTKYMQSFESEHKVGIYYFRISNLTNQKWGTKGALYYDDPKYGFPISLRAFGNFSFFLSDPKAFFINVVGARELFSQEEARFLLFEKMIQTIEDSIAESGFSFAQVDRNRDELAQKILKNIAPIATTFGFTLTDFRIEGVDFSQETLDHVHRIAEITAEKRAAEEAGVDFTDLQKLTALRDAAKNEGGVAGTGMAIGAGVALGNAFLSGNGNMPSTQEKNQTERLLLLQQMYAKNLIEKEEFKAKKKEILSQL